jgi:D-sedoheptulose 7-phosphate isomerase
MTAVANDFSFDHVYARYVSGAGNQGDILIGISTSGNSTNIIHAFSAAKEKGMITVGLTGSTGGKMKNNVDFLLCVPSDDTTRIQEAHILIGHIICELVESRMFPK